jgi:hypothetical protein
MPSPTNPSPGPPRLKKTPAAGHPLPKGEGCRSEGERAVVPTCDSKLISDG